MPRSTHEIDVNVTSSSPAIEGCNELRHGCQRWSVHRQNQVLNFDTGFFRVASGRDIGNDHSPVLCEVKSSSESRRHVLNLNPNVAVSDVATSFQFFENRPHNLACQGKAQSLVSIVHGHHKANYADQVAVSIDQSTAATAVAYGRISLYETAAFIAFTVTTNRADHAHGNRVLETFRTSHCEYQLPRSNLVGVRERNSW